jgi:hypothetical protein
VLGAVTDRIARARRVATRATTTPMLVRAAIALCGVLAVVVAYPAELVVTQYVLILLVVAVVPALLPRGRAASVAAVVIVGGWILDTTWYGERVELWRVLALATLLYLGHTLTALAAVLPYDAVVHSDVVTLWVGRALGVVLVSAVLTVVVLALTAEIVGGTLLIATLVGLAAAVGATILLARLLRRS